MIHQVRDAYFWVRLKEQIINREHIKVEKSTNSIRNNMRVILSLAVLRTFFTC
jgi:hypothetical protein